MLFVSTAIFGQNKETESSKINHLLDSWHEAAAKVDFEKYFDVLTADAIYIGTDATEYWDVPAFKKFAKPFFDRGQTWNFKAINRHVYFDSSENLAWFDELLDTQMKICRGSGILIKENGVWKIKHYVLSMAIPNENVDEVVSIKTPIEDNLMKSLRAEK